MIREYGSLGFVISVFEIDLSLLLLFKIRGNLYMKIWSLSFLKK